MDENIRTRNKLQAFVFKETVEKETGVTKSKFLKICEEECSSFAYLKTVFILQALTSSVFY